MPNIDIKRFLNREPQPRPELPILFVEVTEDKKGVAFQRWEDLKKAVISYGMGEFASTKEARAEELAKLNAIVHREIRMASPLRGMEIHVAASNHKEPHEARQELEEALEDTKQKLDGQASSSILAKSTPSKTDEGLGMLTAGEVFLKGLSIAKNDEWGQKGYRVALYDDPTTEAEFATKEGANLAISKIAVSAKLHPHEVNTKYIKGKVVDIDCDQLTERLQQVEGLQQALSASDMAADLTSGRTYPAYSLGEIDGFMVFLDYGDLTKMRRNHVPPNMLRKGNVLTGNLGKGWNGRDIIPDLRVVISDRKYMVTDAERVKQMQNLGQRIAAALQPTPTA